MRFWYYRTHHHFGLLSNLAYLSSRFPIVFESREKNLTEIDNKNRGTKSDIFGGQSSSLIRMLFLKALELFDFIELGIIMMMNFPQCTNKLPK
jgi:hypothetical protein